MGIIYCVRNKINGKLYIGQTILSFSKRKLQHERFSGRSAITAAIRKYGIENFEWRILDEDVPEDQLDAFEIDTIAVYNTIAPNGYNLKTGGARGRHSEESKRKMSIAKKNMTSETKRKIGRAQIGRKHTDETKEKMSISRNGKKHSDESKRKMSEAGKNKSPETLNKMRQSARNMTDEHRRRLSDAQKGKKHSDETKLKMSESAKCKPPMSEESRQKLSIAMKCVERTEEHRKKLGDSLRGKKRTPEQRNRILLAAKAGKLKAKLLRESNE